MPGFDTNCLADVLPTYYNRLFPINLMHRWLSYGNDEVFSHREFSFTLSGDVYIRYQSFDNKEDFLKQLKKKLPEKIDIGAVYTTKPKSRDGIVSFQPVQKEFVLDIDLTDYDDVRTCCSGATVCEKCWKLIGIAVTILDVALRDDFGFEQLLWVFSGRRGVHCWVCDETARNLDVSARSVIVDYLQLIKGGEEQAKKVKVVGPHIHASIMRALDTIEDHFETVCLTDQDIFDVDKNLDVLPSEWKNSTIALASNERWDHVQELFKGEKKKKFPKYTEMEVKLQFCYPRLDANVSKGLNHLLKSPFCIHPKTGQVCVPFDPKKVFQFKIKEVPTLTQLIEEIGAHDAEHANETGLADWKKTSLAPYMQIFDSFIKGLQKQNAKTTSEAVKMEF